MRCISLSAAAARPVTASSAPLILNRWTPMTACPHLSCKYRAATDFCASLKCLLIFVVTFYFALTAYFVYDNGTYCITLGYCFAARCAEVHATLHPSLLLLRESYVMTTRHPSLSSIRFFFLMAMTIGSAHGLALWMPANTGRESSQSRRIGSPF